MIKRQGFTQHHAGAGFTLIELLVVISIIGVLSSVALVNLNSARKHARDTVRKANVATLIKLLQAYYTENGEWPYMEPAVRDADPGINFYSTGAKVCDGAGTRMACWSRNACASGVSRNYWIPPLDHPTSGYLQGVSAPHDPFADDGCPHAAGFDFFYFVDLDAGNNVNGELRYTVESYDPNFTLGIPTGSCTTGEVCMVKLFLRASGLVE